MSMSPSRYPKLSTVYPRPPIPDPTLRVIVSDWSVLDPSKEEPVDQEKSIVFYGVC